MQQRGDERSLGGLFASLAAEPTELVQQEIRLAKTEVTQKATSTGWDLGMIAAGSLLAYAALLALIAALVIGLGQVIPLWLSALLVGLVVIGVGYVPILRGISAFKWTEPTP